MERNPASRRCTMSASGAKLASPTRVNAWMWTQLAKTNAVGVQARMTLVQAYVIAPISQTC